MCIRVELNQTKNGFLALVRAVDEVERGAEKLLVDRLHALLGERPGVLALLLAPGAEARVLAGRLRIGRDAFHHAARAEIAP